MRIDPIEKLREVCLAMPEVVEKEAWGEATFRVRGKMFAMTDNNHHDSGHVAVWCMAPPLAQAMLVESNPDVFFVPPYVGHKGWVGVRLDRKLDWKQIAQVLSDAHREATTKRPSKLRAAASLDGLAPRRARKRGARGSSIKIRHDGWRSR